MRGYLKNSFLILKKVFLYKESAVQDSESENQDFDKKTSKFLKELLLKFLVEGKFNLNEVDNLYERSALHWAVYEK